MWIFKVILILYALIYILLGIIVKYNIGNSQYILKEYISNDNYISNNLPINCINNGFFLLIIIWLALFS